jgi:hypothetical protein
MIGRMGQERQAVMALNRRENQKGGAREARREERPEAKSPSLRGPQPAAVVGERRTEPRGRPE